MRADTGLQLSRSGLAGACSKENAPACNLGLDGPFLPSNRLTGPDRAESKKLPRSFCWYPQIFNFLLLYRDLALEERNERAANQIDELIVRVKSLATAQEEISVGSNTSVPSLAEEVKINIKQK